MLIGISGAPGAGKDEITRYLIYQGFSYITLGNLARKSALKADEEFEKIDELLSYVTNNWQRNIVLSPINDSKLIELLSVRPFFLHLIVDAPSRIRYQRFIDKHSNGVDFEFFVTQSEALTYTPEFLGISQDSSVPTVKVINSTSTVKDLYVQLSSLDILNPLRLRPNWDTYFMKLASLAALRSNCMKRRVGCIIAKDNRVIATGYNGTPKNMLNCNRGGCDRCNNTNGSGNSLATCLCLHAEENALLESGRDRISSSSNCILYCNTCPCLTCSIKIIQSGIKEVVYSQSYSMDTESRRILNEAGVILRQFSPPKEMLIN